MMPTPYRGRMQIVCRVETCIIDRSRKNVMAECIDCTESTVEILDLDEKVISKKTKAAKRLITEEKEEANDGI